MNHAPTTQSEAVDIIRGGLAKSSSLKIVGGGTRQSIGRDVFTDEVLSTGRLVGITLYEPAELVMSARVGTSLAEIKHELSSRGQFMAFEPPDFRETLESAGVPSIGGVFATNSSGPRRLVSGAARDHLLGVTLINGRADVIRAGGRVMKNVTGLDVTKLVCGAYGTLGLMTEVTFKVLPRPTFEQTLVLRLESVSDAVNLMTRAMGTPFEISGAAFRDHKVYLRVEGVAESVRYRIQALAAALSRQDRIIEAEESAATWRDIKSLAGLGAPTGWEIWRLSIAPSKVASALALLPPECRLLLDWSGGLAWIASELPIEDVMRPAAARAGGHLMLFRAAEDRRRAISPFHPLSAGTKRLTQGIKNSLDPSRIFNPGKMYEDI